MYIAIAEKDGIWVQLSKPCKRKDAELFKDCALKNETFKIVTEEEFNNYKKTI